MNQPELVAILYIGATQPVTVLPEVAAAAIGNGLAVEFKPQPVPAK